MNHMSEFFFFWSLQGEDFFIKKRLYLRAWQSQNNKWDWHVVSFICLYYIKYYLFIVCLSCFIYLLFSIDKIIDSSRPIRIMAFAHKITNKISEIFKLINDLLCWIGHGKPCQVAESDPVLLLSCEASMIHEFSPCRSWWRHVRR